MSDETPEKTPPENPAGTPSEATPKGADLPPMELSVNPRSPHFDQAALQRGVGIRFKGRQRTDIEAGCACRPGGRWTARASH